MHFVDHIELIFFFFFEKSIDNGGYLVQNEAAAVNARESTEISLNVKLLLLLTPTSVSPVDLYSAPVLVSVHQTMWCHN